MGRRAWQATAHGVRKESDTTEQLTLSLATRLAWEYLQRQTRGALEALKAHGFEVAWAGNSGIWCTRTQCGRECVGSHWNVSLVPGKRVAGGDYSSSSQSTSAWLPGAQAVLLLSASPFFTMRKPRHRKVQ